MLKTMRRLIDWTGQRKRWLYWGFLWSFLQALFTAMPIMGVAYVLKLIVDDQTGRIELKPILSLYLLLFMVLMVLGRFLFSYLRAVFQESIGHEVTAEERMKIGYILKRVSLGFFDRISVGELVGAVTTDLSFVEMYSMKMIDTVIGGYIGAAAMILCLAFYSWQAAVIALIGLALSALALRLMGHYSHRNAPIHQKAQNEIINATLEYVRGVAVIKAYGQEGAAIESIRSAYRKQRDINIKIEREYVPCNVLHLFALKASSAAVAFVSALLAMQGGLSVPDFLMLAVFSFVIFGQVEQVNNATHVMQIIGPIIDKLEKIKQAKFIDNHGKDQSLNNYTIEMKNVAFAYDKRRILDEISFTIPQKSTTAIVGPSGSGKTTICNLIARFYDVDAGKVTIGGTDIRNLTLDSLLKNISMVFQNVYLFHDTIGNNIKFGRPDATMEEVMEAAKQARCHEFITDLPDGYDTMVGEGGSSLSGGEKQRISIARAMLKNAPIVILDEATASIDPENEQFVQEAISALTHGKTIIVIAHRLATIENADQILVLQDGQIVQKGTHKQLSHEEGVYRHFISIREKAEEWSLG
ncbi:ABC transporter ATP-binding protein/permease [Sporolactobacillus shoreicorticis]|uniref:ABC transporter ATP-binding protein n=1 Tax=Sporolactobacillus shoreicorticis TaxID=1923877 RepID=A0ABW5S563_9BACL|nr:ABC transporter ATP-binding protein [Sporolactobacillus shoreicorticis]MCO7126465.1 ABC transporter ATP-binding protein/permease [Sporolactobacillus shoreicorticis]